MEFLQNDRRISVSFCFFVYFLLYSLNWAWEMYSGNETHTSLLTSVLTVAYLIYKIYGAFIKKRDILVVLLMSFWVYQCTLTVFGECFCSGVYKGILLSLPNVFVASAILFVVLDEKFYISCYEYSTILKCLCVVFICVPIFLTLHFGITTSLRATGVLIGREVDYQYYGDLCALIFCMTVIYFRHFLSKIVLSFLVLCSLIILGSKSATVGLVLTLFFMSLLWLVKKRSYRMLICELLLVVVVSVGLFIGKDRVYSVVSHDFKWVANIVYMRTNEISYRSRSYIEESNSDTRRSRMLLGDYRYEKTTGLGKGYYTHNIIDTLDKYGIVYFFALCLLYLYVYLRNILLYLTHDNLLSVVSVLCMTYWGILRLFVRATGARYSMVPLGIGIYVLSHMLVEHTLVKGEADD